MSQLRSFAYLVQFAFQRLALVVFALAALALTGASVMAALGLWNWVSLDLQYAGAPVEDAGMYAQIALTVLAVGLCFFPPHQPSHHAA